LKLKPNKKLIKQSVKKWSLENYRQKTKDHKLPVKQRMIRKGIVGDWKNYYNQQQINIVNNIVSQELNDLGYK
ncbi:MAG: hypothetical protein GF390_00925, partial [Candidatus Pacebacteria bacterium]|nr:hypothetical protein [Candidatus Paceibacterota bacterium]